MQSKSQPYQLGILVFALLLLGGFTVANIGQPNDVTTKTTTDAQAAIYINFSMFLSIESEADGIIKGDVTQAGKEDSMEVIGFSHEVTSPRDATTGLPTGKRQHRPLTIVKEIDKASPTLMQALAGSDNLPMVKLRFYRVDASGTEENYYTIELVNAQIVSLRQQATSAGATEVIAFQYQKIIWTIQDGGITAEDDWETPTVP